MDARRIRPALLAIALAIAASAARADTPEQVRAIVSRYLAVTGGDSAFAADTAMHVKAKVAQSGMRGTLELWWHAPDKFLEIENLGPVRFRAGFDGTRGWRTDLNSKKVAPLEGKDLEAMRSLAWFASEQWARADHGGGTLRQSQHAYYKGRSMDAIEVTPPVGPGRTLWFDAQSGLLTRVTHRRDQYRWDEELSGYKLLAGRKRPLTALVGDSLLFEAGFGRTNVDSVRRESPADPAAFSSPASVLRPVTWLKARGVATLPFRYERGHVWVRAAILGGPPADFILDTGCTMTAIDEAYARQAGLELQGAIATEGVGGIGTGGLTRVRGIRIVAANGDGVEVPDLQVMALRLQDEMQTLDWDKVAGLIGYDVLSRFVVDFDFDRHVVTFHDPANYRYTGHGAALPMTLHACIPTVEVALNGGCKGRFLVDVGNATVMSVNSAQVAQCHLFEGHRKEVQHWVGGIGGSFPETVCRLDSVRIGPFAWTEPVAGLTTHHLGGAGSTEIQGNIGTHVLERFRCTFDYARGTLWLEPGARYPLRDGFSRSGLWVARYEGQVVVAAVVRHSPGEDAGLKVRDVLKAIDGRPIDRWTPAQIERLFDEGAAGTTVKLTVERELVDEEIELTLADVL